MPGVISTSIARELGRPDAAPTTASVERAARHLRPVPSPPRSARRSTADGLTGHGAPACSSCARTRSPAGGSRRSSTAPSTATGSRAPPSRSTTDCSAARNCRRPRATASGSGCSRTSRSTSSGTDDEARELDRDGLAQVALAQARATGSWRTIVAPPGEHRPLHAVGTELIEALVGGRPRRARGGARRPGQTDYLQVVQNWGAQAGARTNHLCLDLYDLPQIPHRIAEELGGAARFVIREGECPFCRLVRDEIAPPGPARLGGRRERRLRAVRLALAVRGLDRAAPPRGRLRPRDRRRHLRPPPRRSARSSAALAASLDGPPYNLVLHTAPLREQVDAHVPLALGDPPAPARDRRPRAGNRPAGQPRLARGRGRGAARPRRSGREVDRVDRRPCPRDGRHTWGRCLVSGPTSARTPPTCALRAHPARSPCGRRPSSTDLRIRASAARPASTARCAR